MSTRRRAEHIDLVVIEQVAKHLRRVKNKMRSLGTGPYAPGPWWPEGHAKHCPLSDSYLGKAQHKTPQKRNENGQETAID